MGGGLRKVSPQKEMSAKTENAATVASNSDQNSAAAANTNMRGGKLEADDEAACRSVLEAFKDQKKPVASLLRANVLEQMVRKRGWPKSCRSEMWLICSQKTRMGKPQGSLILTMTTNTLFWQSLLLSILAIMFWNAHIHGLFWTAGGTRRTETDLQSCAGLYQTLVDSVSKVEESCLQEIERDLARYASSACISSNKLCCRIFLSMRQIWVRVNIRRHMMHVFETRVL
jgi:hypothetical protein